MKNVVFLAWIVFSIDTKVPFYVLKSEVNLTYIYFIVVVVYLIGDLIP